MLLSLRSSRRTLIAWALSGLVLQSTVSLNHTKHNSWPIRRGYEPTDAVALEEPAAPRQCLKVGRSADVCFERPATGSNLRRQLPTMIGIGAAKSGTSAMNSYLTKHPDYRYFLP